jgi:hypothetical protein
VVDDLVDVLEGVSDFAGFVGVRVADPLAWLLFQRGLRG